MLWEFRAKERKILCDLASACHGKEARGQGFEYLAHSAESSRLKGLGNGKWDGWNRLRRKQGQGPSFLVSINGINTASMVNPWTVKPP